MFYFQLIKCFIVRIMFPNDSVPVVLAASHEALLKLRPVLLQAINFFAPRRMRMF